MTAVVIGAGTNGLAAAVRLARAGRKVTVLEAAGQVGGIAAGVEFHPGFRSAGLLDDAAVDPWGAELGLVGAPRPAPVALEVGAEPVGEESAALDAWINRLQPVLAPLLAQPPPRLDAAAPLTPLVRLGVAIRRAGAGPLRELLRVPLLSAHDWLGELGIGERSRGLIAAPGLLGGVVGPRQPTTAGLLVLSRLRGAQRISGPRAVSALSAAARAAGVTVRTGTSVSRIRAEGGAVRGVSLADGTAVDAPLVVAAIDPASTLRALLDPFDAGTAMRRAAATIRTRCAVVQLLVAYDGLPDDRLSNAWIDVSTASLEAAFDRRKYREFAERPAGVHVTVPSRVDPELAPPGAATVSIRWIAAPSEGWTDDRRARTADALIAAVERVSPGFSSAIRATRLVVPVVHPFHAEHAVDQSWVGRPAFGLGRYATRIAGLYLGSAGTHPGGGVVGTPGWLAAGEAL